ncbi:LuxR C-terminal-related transcriptional regulator [Nocardia sp. NPDC059246]|uniref:LuxR C-terminal-related transcriptional regulator n=1 Tax=unclassified Nocardia TaxID=2637762 RepID=UPI0036836421
MVAASDEGLDPAVALRVRTSIAAATPDRPGLGRVLFELSRVVAFEQAALTRFDPVAGVHRTAASVGYPPGALEVIDTCLHSHPMFTRLRDERVPLELAEVPATARSGPVFERVIVPLGYRQGLTQPLFGVDGRYLGMLNMSGTAGVPFSRSSITALALLADVVGAALDPCRSPETAVDPGESVVLVGPGNDVHAVTEFAAPGLFAPGTAGFQLARLVAESGCPRDYLLLVGGVVYRTRMRPARSGGTRVAYRRIDPPHALTLRELEVLALLPAGGSNARIAADLGVEPSTIATHIERILRKLNAPNRTVAATTAARWGLEVDAAR